MPTTSTIYTGDSASVEQTQRKVARKSNGDIWVTYRRSDGTYNQVWVAYSTNKGSTWTEEQVTDASAAQSGASIAVDSDDNIHLVWGGSGWGDYTDKQQICYRKRTSSWQTQEQVTNVDVNQNTPNIAIDSDDNVHVVWSGRGWGDYTTKAQIQYRKRTTSWQTQESVTNIDENHAWACIAIDSEDNIHVAWQSRGYGTYTARQQIHYRKRTTSWQTIESVVDMDAGYQNQPWIAIDSSDNVHVTWYGQGWGDYDTTYQILYRKRTSSWQTTEQVTNKNAAQFLPSIALDTSDNVHITWFGTGWGTNTAVNNIQYRKRTSSWQTQVGITDEATVNRVPIIIYANYPDPKTNIPKEGYMFVYMKDSDVSIRFYASADLEWEGETTDTSNFFLML